MTASRSSGTPAAAMPSRFPCAPLHIDDPQPRKPRGRGVGIIEILAEGRNFHYL